MSKGETCFFFFGGGGEILISHKADYLITKLKK